MTHQLEKDITERMGHQRLPSKTWARMEIILGGFSAFSGQLYSTYQMARMALTDELSLAQTSAGVILAILGLYLYSAGNRSMMYRSQNIQTSYLEGLINKKS